MRFLLPFLLLSHLKGWANLPPEAKKIVDELPDKKVTLKLVLGKAIETSDSFRIIAAEKLRIQAPAWLAQAKFGPQAFAEIGWREDKKETPSPFSPQEIHGRQYKLGIQKLFTTGTGIRADISHSYNDLTFATVPFEPYYETLGTLAVTQKLWKNSFGYSSRLIDETGGILTKVNHATLEENYEQWILTIVDLFYGAWLAQAQARTAISNVERRDTLVRITKLKVRRGTSEEPDLLQVQAAAIGARVRLSDAQEKLNDTWRELVTALKLPDKWLKIDPLYVPMGLDQRFPKSIQSCGPKEKSLKEPQSSISVLKAKLQAEAALNDLKAKKNALNPDLELQLSLSGNGIDPARGQSFDQAIRIDNPEYRIGLKLTVPLGMYAEKAEVAMAAADHIKAEARHSIQVSQNKLDWLNRCSKLRQLNESYLQLKTAWEKQKRRARLEQKRFSLGRSPTITVIQAEDDATLAESQKQATESALRTAAWKVDFLTGRYKKYMEETVGFKGFSALTDS